MTTATNRRLIFAAAGLAFGLASWNAVAHDPKKHWPVPAEAIAMKNPLPASPEGLKAAKTIYEDKCAQCHGDTGKGDGSEAAMYDVKPADLTDAHMMSEMTDGEIFYKISNGRMPMPTFKKQLNEEQRWQLVHLVRTFAPKLHPKKETAKPAKKAAPKKNQ